MKEFVEKMKKEDRLLKESDVMKSVQKAIVEMGYEPFGEKQELIYKAIESTKEHNNGWISVEDALPKESMPVLVTTGMEMIWTAFYDRTHGTWVDDVRGKVLNVIAWMEFPAPYRKG